jgi:hypothetical protein
MDWKRILDLEQYKPRDPREQASSHSKCLLSWNDYKVYFSGVLRGNRQGEDKKNQQCCQHDRGHEQQLGKHCQLRTRSPLTLVGSSDQHDTDDSDIYCSSKAWWKDRTRSCIKHDWHCGSRRCEDHYG